MRTSRSLRGGLLEAGPLEAELEPPMVSAVDLIGQYDLQEGCVVELLPPCESDPLRQGVQGSKGPGRGFPQSKVQSARDGDGVVVCEK